MRDFFISYSRPDMSWADWIAWELDAAGFEVFLQRWDFPAGSNFVQEMQRGVSEFRRLILVLSHASIASRYVDAEWAAFFAADPSGKERRLVPVRVDDCTPPGLLAQISYIDLHGVTEATARERLLTELNPDRRRPDRPPAFPGGDDSLVISGPAFPKEARVSPLPRHLSSPADASLEQRDRLPSIRRRQQGRAFAIQYLPTLLSEAIEGGRPLAVVVLDVDGMTSLNGRFGVAIGDAVIERLIFLCEQVRDRYLVARTGDDTLMVVVRESVFAKVVDAAHALVAAVADHDWDAIAAGMFVHCSAGVAAIDGASPFESILRAMYALQIARRSGGNRVATELALPTAFLRIAKQGAAKPSLPDS